MPQVTHEAGSAPKVTGRQRDHKPTRAHTLKLEEIKTAAARQFFRVGYAASDVRTIAHAVNLHVSTLYTYISGKEELLFLIVEDGIQQVSASVDAALADATDPLDALRNAIEAMIVHHASRNFLAWTSYVEIRSLTGEWREQITRAQHEYEAKWLNLLARGSDAGVLDITDPKLAMYMILSTGHSVSNWFDPKGRLTANELAPLIADQLIFGLKARRSERGRGKPSPRRPAQPPSETIRPLQ